MWKMIFARRGICSKILKCLKIEKILFRSFFMKIIFRKSWNAPCFHFKNQMRKVWHFEKKHVIDFEMGKGPKINLFDFRAFQDFRAYALTCKIILYMLVGAFQGTPRKSFPKELVIFQDFHQFLSSPTFRTFFINLLFSPTSLQP